LPSPSRTLCPLPALCSGCCPPLVATVHRKKNVIHGVGARCLQNDRAPPWFFPLSKLEQALCSAETASPIPPLCLPKRSTPKLKKILAAMTVRPGARSAPSHGAPGLSPPHESLLRERHGTACQAPLPSGPPIARDGRASGRPCASSRGKASAGGGAPPGAHPVPPLSAVAHRRQVADGGRSSGVLPVSSSPDRVLLPPVRVCVRGEKRE
jgi:hypothetical protein